MRNRLNTTSELPKQIRESGRIVNRARNRTKPDETVSLRLYIHFYQLKKYTDTNNKQRMKIQLKKVITTIEYCGRDIEIESRILVGPSENLGFYLHLHVDFCKLSAWLYVAQKRKQRGSCELTQPLKTPKKSQLRFLALLH